HAGIWALLRPVGIAPDVTQQLASISYSPFADSSHPDRGVRPTAEQIRSDLRTIAPLTRAIRTYSATGGAELVPPIAAEFDLKVAVGAWVDKDERRTDREIRSAVDLVRKNRNVYSLVIGNEAIFRGDLSVDADNGVLSKEDRERKAVDELIKLIQRAKREVQVPVSTGEIFSVWLDHPELVAAVDYIAVHILPYW